MKLTRIYIKKESFGRLFVSCKIHVVKIQKWISKLDITTIPQNGKLGQGCLRSMRNHLYRKINGTESKSILQYIRHQWVGFVVLSLVLRNRLGGVCIKTDFKIMRKRKRNYWGRREGPHFVITSDEFTLELKANRDQSTRTSNTGMT